MTFPNIDDVKHAEKMLKENPDKWYRCANCSGIWEKITPEDEMIEEYKKDYPNDPEMKMPRAIICDDCYKEYKDWRDNLTPERRKEIDEEYDEEIEKDLEKLTEGFANRFMMEYYKQWSIDNE